MMTAEIRRFHSLTKADSQWLVAGPKTQQKLNKLTVRTKYAGQSLQWQPAVQLPFGTRHPAICLFIRHVLAAI